MRTFLIVLGVIAAIAVAAFVALYYAGRKMSAKQVDSQRIIDANKQTVTALIIDTKRMRFKDAPFPKQVLDQIPWYSKFFKVGVVKAKIGPKIFNFMADGDVFGQLPKMGEVKVKISGLYITEVLKGGVLSDKEKKKREKAKAKAEKEKAKADREAAKEKAKAEKAKAKTK